MKEPKRYYCGNGEGMFEDDKSGHWVEYSEHKVIVEALTEQLRQPHVSGSLPISKVVFFELKNGKYLASNGVEVTTDFILKHEHSIFHDNGYVIVERQ